MSTAPPRRRVVLAFPAHADDKSLGRRPSPRTR